MCFHTLLFFCFSHGSHAVGQNKAHLLTRAVGVVIWLGKGLCLLFIKTFTLEVSTIIIIETQLLCLFILLVQTNIPAEVVVLTWSLTEIKVAFFSALFLVGMAYCAPVASLHAVLEILVKIGACDLGKVKCIGNISDLVGNLSFFVGYLCNLVLDLCDLCDLVLDLCDLVWNLSDLFKSFAFAQRILIKCISETLSSLIIIFLSNQVVIYVMEGRSSALL